MNPVRARRLAMGLTPPQLARRADVSQRTIDSVERGGDCRQSTKRRLLNALRIPFYRKGEFFPERGGE